MIEDAARAKIVSHLRALAAHFEQSYSVAIHLSEVLVSAVLLLNKVQMKQAEPWLIRSRP